MAHLLIVELPGGNDTDIVEAALQRGDRFSFLTAGLEHYRGQAAVWAWLQRAAHVMHVADMPDADIHARVLALHAREPFDGVLCLMDLRLVLAAELAHALGLPFLNPASARLLRDKFSVRSRLLERGIGQGDFALAQSNAEIQNAVTRLGLPLLIKPVDGFGSQNIVLLEQQEDLDPWMSPLDDMLPSGVDYGLGVRANDRLLVERFLHGTVIGCDTFSRAGVHQLLGVNEKLMFDRPSFAIRGGCFTPMGPQFQFLQDYVFALLNAVDFDWGAAHIELMLTPQGPQLIEINARLVGAKIARQVGLAIGMSLHARLIELHLGQTDAVSWSQAQFAATRWVTAPRRGTLDRIELPVAGPEIRCVEMLKQPGDPIQPPMDNADRIGYVVACADAFDRAQAAAQSYVDHCICHYRL